MTDATTARAESPNDDKPRLSQFELEDLRDAFRLLDTSSTGKVSVKELNDILKEMISEQNSTTAMSYSTRQHLQRLTRTMSSLSADEQLDEEAFIQLVTARDPNDERSELQKVFDLFSNGKDYISLPDLERVAEDLGENMSQEELEEMLERVAPDGSKVTLKEFTEIMNRKLFS